jgi:hypothetical protein
MRGHMGGSLRYLDAHTGHDGNVVTKAVLRDARTDHTQEWLVRNGNGPIRQGGVTDTRWLLALSASEDDDFGVVTRSGIFPTDWTLGNYSSSSN